MSQSITIDKANKEDVLRRSKYLKEEIKMSLISMAMNIGHFNINVSIKKDEDRRRDIIVKRAQHDQRIKEVLEKRNNILANYYMHDYMG